MLGMMIDKRKNFPSFSWRGRIAKRSEAEQSRFSLSLITKVIQSPQSQPTVRVFPALKFIFLSFLFLLISRVFTQSIEKIVSDKSTAIVVINVWDITGSKIGQGSGFFISNSGLILTNAHVISDAYSAEVITSFGTFNKVTVIYEDESKDLAIVRINEENTPQIDILENVNFEPGQRVIAIGNPLGLEKTVSDGLISGIRLWENNVELIQITVPISPGSSGGALFNMSGELIGITASTLQGGQNINFAISVNTIINFIDDLIKTKQEGKLQTKELKVAGESLFLRKVLKWVINIFILIIALLFGDRFYFVWPILIFGIYLIYLVFYGLWKVVTIPINKLRTKKNISSYPQYDRSSYNYSASEIDENYDTDIYQEHVDIDHVDEPPMQISEVKFHCSNCNTKILPDDKFCRNCGIPVSRNLRDKNESQLSNLKAKRTILIVDDDYVTREIIKKVLKTKFPGYYMEILTAADGEEALKEIYDKDGRIDLILTNIFMPKINGYNLIKQVFKSYPKMKIMICSGHAKKEHMDILLAKKIIVGYLRKPFEVEELIESVNRILL